MKDSVKGRGKPKTKMFPKERELLKKEKRGLQGQASILKGGENEMRVFSIIAKDKPTFPELEKKSGLSRPVLYVHCGNLLKSGFIFKDTVKPHESDDPDRVGKIVFKPVGSLMEQFTRNFVEMRMKTSDLIEFDEDTKRELEKHYDAIAKIWNEWLKGQVRHDKELLGSIDKSLKGKEGKWNNRDRNNDIKKCLKEDAERE
jgi:hypothetical protein